MPEPDASLVHRIVVRQRPTVLAAHHPVHQTLVLRHGCRPAGTNLASSPRSRFATLVHDDTSERQDFAEPLGRTEVLICLPLTCQVALHPNPTPPGLVHPLLLDWRASSHPLRTPMGGWVTRALLGMIPAVTI